MDSKKTMVSQGQLRAWLGHEVTTNRLANILETKTKAYKKLFEAIRQTEDAKVARAYAAYATLFEVSRFLGGNDDKQRPEDDMHGGES